MSAVEKVPAPTVTAVVLPNCHCAIVLVVPTVATKLLYVPARHAPAVGAGLAETAGAEVGEVDTAGKLADGIPVDAAVGNDVELNDTVGNEVGVELRGEAVGEAVSEGEHERAPTLKTTSLPFAPAAVAPHVPASIVLAGLKYDDPPPPPPA